MIISSSILPHLSPREGTRKKNSKVLTDFHITVSYRDPEDDTTCALWILYDYDMSYIVLKGDGFITPLSRGSQASVCFPPAR